jgi:membrane-associated phospholipid phosphatase
MDVQASLPLDSSPQGPCPRCNWKLGIAAVLLWLLAIGIAFKFYAQIADSVERFTTTANGTQISIGILNKFNLSSKILCVPGTFYFTLPLAALLFFLHPLRWRAAAMLILAGMIGGIIYQFSKWAIGRTRPQYHQPYVFNHFTDGLHGFFSAEKLSCPSGHSMLAFATAMILSMLIPRWRVLFFVLACVVGAERVLEHSHYLSDVVAGAGVGVISALLAKWIVMSKMAENQKAI